MKEFLTNNSQQTQELAQKVAQLVRRGMVLTLNGDLGAGKTTFTQGFARALGVAGRVKSPTFNIMNTYMAGETPIYHFDAYTLETMGAENQGFEDFIGTDGITLIEWPQYMVDILPNDRIDFNFQRTNEDDQRQITIHGIGQLANFEDAL
ncbi:MULTISPECIES: tRNA (adenosine(37)-N6)-threonylcarbamoyltransferase complex ATPase subunit type 1 TsaE [Leuconostoc]|uniref:tRNA (adenosine(37)-N6)-threonylcarbamoyltransferase complex ATPase subunit type 1 TsaE n=1 Tax=Leuconostoc TaxID=1243 RepID=UPI000461373F|nr:MULTISPECIES: tRNA (adenosine(37)-N6)-threonylcarbamoyltransferase complex ATPase subunit type 1 TsaE [Leuconostoc]KDA48182.1 ATPase YjeE [Leuconostoc pseudomesenteroides 1159]KDA50096.1 ATPase YjeE, predicted to have essential role in cell wall biosynthesis [Leuconostoc pseudomesenteroides PS12]OQJ75007.1 tRNA (adenosine(37)-N6)-threonylcarbamoyltransferase complex ATPase subunit type 1 TsaE [Leuconostoc pseudomesenteroides]MDG9744641.1 tRNA (adenosine(37)-N6)-threonylcarbamoyltransferase c